MSDTHTLIQRWQNGDERAAEALYNQCREATLRLAYGLLGNQADAEEAAQDALVYALTQIKRFDPSRANFTTWLHTITVSRCRNHHRRRSQHVPSFAWQEMGDDLADPAPTPEHYAGRSETRDQIWQAIQSLKPPLREAILLRYWADHTYREIADILGCPVPTAQSRVRLAYEQLRKRLTPTDLVELEEEQAL